jgi:hypothetical protein
MRLCDGEHATTKNALEEVWKTPVVKLGFAPERATNRMEATENILRLKAVALGLVDTRSHRQDGGEAIRRGGHAGVFCHEEAQQLVIAKLELR